MKTYDFLKKTGFTMLEATIVVAIFGVLAVFAVPRYTSNIERGIASDAFTYLAQVEAAQERFHVEHGQYGQSLNNLNVSIAEPLDFRVLHLTSMDWQSRWQLHLVRRGHSSGYGEYTVAFDQNGFSEIKSSIPAALQP